jgi:hypothetical protein
MISKVLGIGLSRAKTAVVGFGCKNPQVWRHQKNKIFKFVGLLRQAYVFATSQVDRFQPSVAPD